MFVNRINLGRQKQPSRGVLRKRYSENMQQIYRRTSMPKCDFNKDEELAEKVRKYPCLYDKASEHYKDKRKVANAWKRVDEQLGSEEANTLFNQ